MKLNEYDEEQLVWIEETLSQYNREALSELKRIIRKLKRDD